jgi:hypothetical protein
MATPRTRFSLLALTVMVNLGGILVWVNLLIWEASSRRELSFLFQAICFIIPSCLFVWVCGLAVTWAQGLTGYQAEIAEREHYLRQEAERMRQEFRRGIDCRGESPSSGSEPLD